MQKAMDETQQRRQKQLADKLAHTAMQQVHVAQMTAQEVSREIKRLEKQMHEHALSLAFELATETNWPGSKSRPLVHQGLSSIGHKSFT